MLGKKIRSLDDLVIATVERKAIILDFDKYTPDRFSYMLKPRPAAWVLHFDAFELWRMMNRGLYIYESPKKRKKR